MFYASKLVNDVMVKQAAADATLAGFSDEVRHAIALAEHFESIQAEEYVVPSRLAIAESDEQLISAETNLWAGSYSRL